MRVFVTGATGFIGSVITKELISAGHSVVGLARTDAAAAALTAAGAEVHRGSLEDGDSLRTGAARADGVIHTAFIHDFTRFKENCETDRRAIEALGAALQGSDRPLVVTSGTGLVTPGRIATEADATTSSAIPRVASEEAAAAVASRGVRVSVVRLPPSVHGAGDHGFVPNLIALARQKGLSAYIGTGRNLWPAVHRFDAARLFRLVLESATPAARYHGVAEEGVPFGDIAASIGRHLNVPVATVNGEAATNHFGWFAHFAALDNPASSRRTREQLGWRPQERGLIADLEEGHYFA